jgi:hypothetical protein
VAFLVKNIEAHNNFEYIWGSFDKQICFLTKKTYFQFLNKQKDSRINIMNLHDFFIYCNFEIFIQLLKKNSSN